MKRSDEPFFTPEQKTLIAEHLLKGAPDFEIARFLIVCERTGLDPFSRQIYGRLQSTRVKGYGEQPDKFTQSVVIITSIDGFRAIAERSGEYAGQTPPEWFYLNPETSKSEWQDVFLAKRDSRGNLLTTLDACRVGVKRKGWDAPVFGVANFESFAVYEKKKVGEKEEWYLGKFWNQMPEHMIAKVAEAQAIRKAFPLLASGLYVEEELRDEDTEIPVKQAEALPEGAKWIEGHSPEERAATASTPPKPAETAAPTQTAPAETKPAGEPATEPKTRKPRGAAKPAETPAPETQQPAKPAEAAQTLEELQKAPEVPWDDPKKEEPKTEPGPFGDPEPVKPPQAKPAPAPAADASGEPEWKNHVIQEITLVEFFNKRIGDLTPELIKKAYRDWVAKYGDKFKASGNTKKMHEAAMLTEAFNVFFTINEQKVISPK